MSSINGTNIERMRVNNNEIALAKINGNVVFQKKKLIKTFYGDSRQETTTGKNLFNYSYYYDNYIPPENGNIGRLLYTLKPNTDYTISTNRNSTAANTTACIFSWSGSEIQKNNISTENEGILSTSPRTITTDDNGNLVFGLYISGDFKVEKSEFESGETWIQIEEGSTATNYEPYTGGKPSPNPDYPQTIKSITGASLKLTGKNLFNINKYVEDDSDYYSLQNDNLICEVIDSRTQGFVYTKFEKGTYTVSTTNVCNISIHEENSNYWFLRKQNINQFTFTLEEDKNLHFKFFKDNVPYNIGKVQIEKGSQRTTYEPYKNQTIPINLQGNILAKVGDYVDELQVYSNGDVKIVKKIGKTILNNTANYTKSTYSTDEYFRGYLNGEETLNFAEYKKVMNTHFQSGEYNQTSQGEMLANRRQLHIQILASRLSENSVTGLQEWLENNNVTALRPLANSITRKVDNIKEELNSFGDYSNIEIETTYS